MSQDERLVRCTAWLLDHLMGTSQKGRRQHQAERTRGLEVHGQMDLSRLLHGKVGGLRALYDLIDVPGCSMPRLNDVGAVLEKAAGLGKPYLGRHCWKSMPDGRLSERGAHRSILRSAKGQERGGASAPSLLHGQVDVARAARFHTHNLDVQTSRRVLRLPGRLVVQRKIRDPK